LFLPGSRQWNEQLIRMDADEILKMKPGNTMEEDILAWAFDKGGSFWTAVKELLGMKLPWMHRQIWTTDLLAGAICSLKEAAVFVCGVWSLWSGRNS
ncbi:hypothetical protein BAE44_0005107, partial [Dichanthelium oligosanthes]